MRKFILMTLGAAIIFLTACKGPENSNIEVVRGSLSESGYVSDISDTSEKAPETYEATEMITEGNQNEQSDDKEDNAMNIEITVNGHTFSAGLYDNETARAFKEQLPFTLEMSELNGNEKYYYLSESLPTDSRIPSKIHTGDIMLYGSSCLVIFYEDFSTSYSYTPIGKINAPDGLATVLGSGSVQVDFK